MNYGFNHDQFQKDVDDFVKFFTGFGKSYGPSAKKVSGKEIGFFEEMYIRFRLWIVELGITQVIRLVLVWSTGIIVWAVLFRRSMSDVRLVLIFGFIVFYVWMMRDHLTKDGKPIDPTATVLIAVYDFWIDLYEGTKNLITQKK